jgi:hypothetical protein
VELQKVKKGEEDGDEKDDLYALIFLWGKTIKICQFFKKGR